MPAISKDKVILLETFPLVSFLFVTFHLRTTSLHRLQTVLWETSCLKDAAECELWHCGAKQDLVRWGERARNLCLQVALT